MTAAGNQPSTIGCGRPSQYDDAVPCGQWVQGDDEPFIALCAVCIGVLFDGVNDDEEVLEDFYDGLPDA